MSTLDLFADMPAGPAPQSPAERAAQLRRLLHHHAHLYYTLDAPQVRMPSTTGFFANCRRWRPSIRSF